MNDHEKARTGAHLLRSRLTYLGCAAALFVAAAIVGVADNPPGIALAYLAILAVVRALTLGLKTLRHYVVLLMGSLFGGVGAVVVCGIAEVVAKGMGEGWVKTVLQVVHVVLFLAALFGTPTGTLVGAVGIVVKWWQRRGTPVAEAANSEGGLQHQ